MNYQTLLNNMDTKTCELCGKDYITDICNGCATLEELRASNDRTIGSIYALSSLILREIESINKGLKAERGFMTEEQLIEREKVSDSVTSSESTIL